MTEVQPSPKQKHAFIFPDIPKKKDGKVGCETDFLWEIPQASSAKGAEVGKRSFTFFSGKFNSFSAAPKKSQRRLSDSFLLASFPFPREKKKKKKD